jgi:hypothetical protein
MRAWCGCSTTWRTSILNQTADRGARVQQFQEVAADLVISVGFGLVAPWRSLDRRIACRDAAGYTPDKTSSLPVLSPNFSTFTPNLSIRLKDRFANGVPFGYLR